MFITSTKRVSGLLAAFAAGLAAITMGGCSNDGENALVLENEALRAELAGERARREGAEAELGSIESERAGLSSELDALRTQLSQSRTTTPASGRSTGFENIDGVTVGFGAGNRSEIVLDIANDILFDSGSATLKASAKRSLDRVADVLRQRYNGRMIRVEGHTDNDPIRRSNWKTNERLSSERAMAVEAYLVERGLNNNNIYTAAFGPARPKNSKAASRRVEIVIVETN